MEHHLQVKYDAFRPYAEPVTDPLILSWNQKTLTFTRNFEYAVIRAQKMERHRYIEKQLLQAEQFRSNLLRELW